jgi:hypothetical protein
MPKFLRYLIRNRTTLQNWIADRGFPPGQLICGNRVWTEDEVMAWVRQSSTTAKRATPRGDWKRGARRKTAATLAGA